MQDPPSAYARSWDCAACGVEYCEGPKRCRDCDNDAACGEDYCGACGAAEREAA